MSRAGKLPLPKLPDPEKCRICKTKGEVAKTRNLGSCRWRRHRCPRCGFRWTSYQTLINPRHLRPREPDKGRQ